MRKILFGCAIALTGLTAPLTAFDGCGGCPPVCDPCCCGPDFNGFYVGGNVGVFTHTGHLQDLDGFLTDNSGWSLNDTDVTVGVQVGYDWQWCTKLLGFVADWSWVNTDRRVHENPNADVDNFFRNESHWFTTIRARAGLALNDAIFYLTAGAAVSRFRTTWNDDVDRFNHRRTHWGWTAGFGTEFLVFCNWSVGAEILWLHFDHHEEDFTSTAGTVFRFGHSHSAYVGRFLVNYRFGNLFGF